MNPWDNDPVVGAASKAAPAPAPADAPWANDPQAKPLTVHGNTPQPDADTGALPGDTTVGGFNVSKANELTGRTAMQAAVKGVLGLPALADDAVMNAGYYGKKALSMTGLVDKPDAANYGLDQTSFPASAAVGKIAEAGPDALGLRKPTTAKDRVVMAGGEGALGAATGVGAGAALRLVPGAAGAAAFLSDAPVAQAASGAVSGAAGQGLAEEGAKPGFATAGGLMAGALPLLALRGGQVARGNALTNTLRPAGQENAAARILQGQASDPALAARNARTAPTLVPGSTPSGIEAAGDAGLNRVDQLLEGMEPAGRSADRGATNNRARVDFLRSAGIGDTAAEDAAYAHAGRVAGAEKPAVLNNRPDMDAGPVLDHFRALNRDRSQTTAIRDMAQAAHDEIRGRTDAVMGTNARGEPIEIGRTINPEHLEAAKTSFASQYTSKAPNANTPAYVMNTRREVFQPGGAMDAFNSHIESGAPGYQAYIDRQAGLRDAADRLNFGNTLLDKSTDAYTANGVPQISPTKFGNLTRPSKLDDVLAPGNRMTLDRMGTGPNSGGALAIDAVRADLERQQQTAIRGTGVRGSNTANKAAFRADQVDAEAQRGLPLSNRALSALAPVTRVVAPLAGFMSAGPLGSKLAAAGTSIAAGQAAGLISAAAGRGTERAATGIRGVLGNARGDRMTMARLLDREVLERPGVRGYVRAPEAPVANFAKPGGAIGAMAVREPPSKRKKKKGR